MEKKTRKPVTHKKHDYTSRKAKIATGKLLKLRV